MCIEASEACSVMGGCITVFPLDFERQPNLSDKSQPQSQAADKTRRERRVPMTIGIGTTRLQRSIFVSLIAIVSVFGFPVPGSWADMRESLRGLIGMYVDIQQE